MARKVSVEIVGDATSVERSFARAGRSAQGFSRSVGHAEKEASRGFRGLAAGSGVFRNLGRSIAFASAGYLAFAGVSDTIRSSVENAENLEKAQKGLDVAIRHTGGSLDVLKPKYTAIAKGAAQFGINQADATTALNRATVLTGNAAKAQRAYQEALVISKATGKDFNSVLTATAKGQEGITTSLQRYGIEIKKGTPGTQQFVTVMSRFAGQAKANTTASDRFRAVLANTETIIGEALLPVLSKYLTKLSNWLEKMDRSGRLQKDVNTVLKDAKGIIEGVAGAIRQIDKVTGSFKHTLELLLALKLASKLGLLSGVLKGLSGAFVGLGAASESAAAGVSAAGIATGDLRVAALAAEGEVTGLNGALAGLGSASVLGPLAALTAAFVALNIASKNSDKYIKAAKRDASGFPILTDQTTGVTAIATPRGFVPTSDPNAANFGGGTGGPRHHRHVGALAPRGQFHPTSSTDPASRKRAFLQFSLPYRLQLEQDRAALTKSTADDVKAARDIIAYIRKELASGRLGRKARLDAINEEASAYQTLWAAQDAANKKRAAAAKKAAKKADSFTEPLALQLADARAQALGLNDRNILLKMKRAALKAIHSGKLSLQGQIDAWNQIASINSQLANQTTSGLAKFKQANTRALTAGLNLTAAQRKALRARLSQLGPNGTVPNSGVGAYGYAISPNTGRPIHIHNHVHLDGKTVANSTTRHQQRRRRRNPSQRRGPNAGG